MNQPLRSLSQEQALEQQLHATLRQAGVRVTHPRLLVLGMLQGTPSTGVAATALYREMLLRDQPLSLSTIYSVLSTFKHTRLVHARRAEDGQQVFALARE